jgi:uncharacterized protein YndB with AHSA1/START domain
MDRGFKTETTDMDVRPGGAWNYVMRHRQYSEFKNRVVYRKVVRHERLEYTHDSGVDGDPSAFEVTIVFEDHAPALQVAGRHAAVHSLRRVTRELFE